MKANLVLLLSLITFYGFSQDVQWATEVIEYSSQFSARDFSASQTTGPPNVLNLGGKDAKAWMASSPDNEEYLIVGFGSPLKARQIAIVESSNPGAISMIYAYDENDVMHLIGEFIPAPASVNNRLLNVFLPTVDFNIKAVKIVIDGSKVPGANSIDAIGISNSVVPVRFGEGFAYRTNPRLAKRTVDLNASGKESDIRPVYSVEEKTLFFTRGYSEGNAGGVNDPGDVWYSTYNERNGQYSEPARLNDNINNIGFNTSNAYYLLDNNPTLLVGNVSGSPNKVRANLSKVRKKDGEWSEFEIQKIKSSSEIPVDAD
jgi:OOP family OmpA-OmpF porin